jgi:hypothetical protein
MPSKAKPAPVVRTIIPYPAHFSAVGDDQIHLAIPDFPQASNTSGSRQGAALWALQMIQSSLKDEQLDQLPTPTAQPSPESLVAPNLRTTPPGQLTYNATLEISIDLDDPLARPTFSISNKIPSKDV